MVNKYRCVELFDSRGRVASFKSAWMIYGKLILQDEVTGVEIKKPLSKQDDTVWRIFLNDSCIELSHTKIESYQAFRTAYIREFNEPCPKLSGSEWLEFVSWLSTIAIEED